MADMIIVEPMALSYGGAAPVVAVSRGAGGANLVTVDPREVWQDTGGAGSANIDIDLGNNTAWDTIVLVNCNGAAAASWTITTGTAAQASYTATNLVAGAVLRTTSDDLADATGPAFYYNPAALNTRYIRLAVSQPVGQPALTIGAVIVGKAFKPTLPREHGAGRPMTDTGIRNRLDDGSLATVSGALLSGFKWVFGDLDPADLSKLFGIIRRRRTTEPVVLVEDPQPAIAEGIHYGTFASLEPYERRDQSKSRWALQVEDWI